MSNPNLFIVYSPEGEKFETSRANARDLTTHAGWSYSPPAASIAACTVPPVKEEPKPAPQVETKTETPAPKDDTDASTSSEGRSEDASEGDEASEAGEGEASEGATGENSEDRKLTADDFAYLETREQAVALLADQFPAFKPHHKQDRDKLVAKLVELSNG